VSGFVVAIFASHRSLDPAGWLADHESGPCVVSDRQFAKFFDDKDMAWNAAQAYRDAHKGAITNWVVQPK
jgi:hypothetical protein